MDTEKIKEWGEREPFLPFRIRLTNNGEYTFEARRDFGAPHNYSVILAFDEESFTMVDPGEVSEIFPLD